MSKMMDWIMSQSEENQVEMLEHPDRAQSMSQYEDDKETEGGKA